MKIHEYQAKQIIAKYGAPVPKGRACSAAAEALDFATEMNAPVVVKAQALVGGRGKAGGIKVARTPAEAESIAETMLGSRLKGLPVKKVLVEQAVDIDQEYYLGITIDRAAQRNVVMVSAAGGIDIEEVAAKTPEKIAKQKIDPGMGLADFQARKVCFEAGLPRETVATAARFLKALYDAYMAVDASLAEINPLILTKDGALIAADAKIVIDDNALFRHPEFAEMTEESEEDEIEAEAHRRGIQYVRLDGDVGVIGNGAGLVMATLDEVNRAGGQPANFLDIGGGAKSELVKNALEVVLLDSRVKGVIFNIFGGITRCDEVAKGIIDAAAELDIKVPIVARLTGTQSELGLQLLEETNLVPAATVQEGAARIVELVRQ